MDPNAITEALAYIVPRTLELNNKYITGEKFVINYASIFSEDDAEHRKLFKMALTMGHVLEDTTTGPLFELHESIKTITGPIDILKIRLPDAVGLVRKVRGDATFTLKHYTAFKSKYLNDAKHFKILDNAMPETIELRDTDFDVLSYFTKPLLQQS